MSFRRAWILALVASAILLVDSSSGVNAEPAPSFGWTVTTTEDEAGACTPDLCTLRAAIAAANASAGTDVITFNIPTEDPGYDPASGQWTITLETPLPALSDDGIALDALTPPGPEGAATARPATPENCGTQRIKVIAALVSYGIEITAADIELTGFSFRYAKIHGVYVHGSAAQNALLLCNEIANNTSDGVHIADGASGSRIGSEDGLGNIISGNGDDGIEITGGATHHTLVANYIGTTASGESAWANSGYGVRIRGVISNTVGLATTGGGNVISGNSQGGILIDGSINPAQDNVIFNNLIGTNAASTVAVPNLDGIVVLEASNNEIGDNVIATNTRNGVTIDGNLATGNILVYNYIGLDRDRLLTTGNGQWGVLLESEATNNTLLFNKIFKNGFNNDYPVRGGVAMTGSSSSNLAWGNEIALNGGDGVYIHSSDRNRLDANSIYGNTLLGINNVSGGNQELPPPRIQKYLLKGSLVKLQATACAGCIVQIFSDDDGEGRHYATELTADAATGVITYTGTPAGKAYTLTATDAMSNTSEFSASPLFLDLSIDDALPHVVVNKVPGDADGQAGKTLVEFTTYVVGYDPSLTRTLELEIQIPSNVLGAPTRVFYRDDLSSMDGTAITSWTNPSAGRYRISGLNLVADPKGGKWTRRVVFRFAMPHSTTPYKYTVYAYLRASARSVSRGVDWAVLHVLKKAEGIVITNRTLLYKNKYRNFDDSEVSQLLQGVYSMAQGIPYNNSPLLAVYYVDAYSPVAKNWDNTSVNYSAGEGTINMAHNSINYLKEDWIEDSTPQWLILPVCKLAVGRPYWLTIVGDDDVIPFYRRGDPTSDEDDSVTSADPVVQALQAADNMFTDNGYANFVEDTCGPPWYWGGVDLYTGRIVGASASDMVNFIYNGMSGPATGSTNRAVAASYDGFNIERIAGYMTGRGFNVLNDSEEPNTLENDDWRLADLLTIMRDSKGFAAFAHQGHANPGSWAAPEDEDLTAEKINQFDGPKVIAKTRPIVTSCGCRSGLSLGQYWNHTVVYGWVRAGASAVVGSTALMDYHPFYSSPGVTYDLDGEQHMRNYWFYLLKISPGNINTGNALVMAKRNFHFGWLVSEAEEKTVLSYALYGLPWTGIYGRIGSSGQSEPPAPPDANPEVAPHGPPEATLSGTYAITYTLDASNYEITAVDGFDVVQVEGMGLTYGDEAPIVPLALIELPLPLGATVDEVTVRLEGETDLGIRDVPMYTPRLPVPGGEPGGYSPTPASFGLFPTQPYTASVTTQETSQLARVYVIPLEYDAATGGTTLYQQLTVRVTYDLVAKVALLDLATDTQNPAPGDPFAVHATLLNASNEPVALTGTLTLENEWGEVVSAEALGPFDVPVGDEFPWELAWAAPPEEGAYRLVLDLWHAGERQALGWQALKVAGGRITSLEVPDRVQPGQPAPFRVAFANARGEPFEGDVLLSIHDAGGALLATLEAPLSAPAQGEASVELAWDTGEMGPGAYTAAARVVAQAGSATYGPVSRPFHLKNLVYLPLVLRSN